MRHSLRAAGAFLLSLAGAACGGDGTRPESGPPLDDAARALILGLPLDAGAMTTPSGGAFAAPACTFQPAVGRFDCEPVSAEGLTLDRSYTFLDAAGGAQRGYDPVTTAKVYVHSRVKGTTPFAAGQAELVMDVDRQTTVSGLQGQETTRTIYGIETGTTQSRLTGGTLNSPFALNDTILNVVVPVGPAPVVPLSGKRISTSTGTSMRNGQPVQVTWRQVVTYNGTRNVPLDVWTDGEQRSCLIDLLNPASVCTWVLPG